jgi:hypothetical protein
MHTRINSENQISIKSILYAIYICSFHYLFSVNSRPSFILHRAIRSLMFPVPRNRSNFIRGERKQREPEGLYEIKTGSNIHTPPYIKHPIEILLKIPQSTRTAVLPCLTIRTSLFRN